MKLPIMDSMKEMLMLSTLIESQNVKREPQIKGTMPHPPQTPKSKATKNRRKANKAAAKSRAKNRK